MSLVYDNFKTLLPSFVASQKEKDLDFLGSDVLSRIDPKDLTLLPSDAPKHILKHLAYMYDVQIEGLSEDEQRSLIEKSFDIHRHLGTTYALKEAIKVLRLEADIIEWYETEGELPPYTFGLKMDGMDSRGTAFLIDYINRFKRESSRLKKLSDGKCKGKAQYDETRYEDSVLSDVQGLVINGVRVCFSSNKDKSIHTSFSVESKAVYHDSKISYLFGNRFDERKYGALEPSFVVQSSTNKDIDKTMDIKRVWQGLWMGNISDAYQPDFVQNRTLTKKSELSISASSDYLHAIDRSKKCKSKAEYENTFYDESVFSDVFCFSKNNDKTINPSYAVEQNVIHHEMKSAYLFTNRFDQLRYGDSQKFIDVTSSSSKNIDKNMHIKRAWLGEWMGHVSDIYRPAFLNTSFTYGKSEIELDSKSYTEAVNNREINLVAPEAVAHSIVSKEMKLQRQWYGLWSGHVSDDYEVSIL